MSWRDSYHLSNLILKIDFALWKLLGFRGRTHSLNWINLCVVSLQDQLNAKVCWSNMLPLMHQTFLYRSSCIIKSHFQYHCISLPSLRKKRNVNNIRQTHPFIDSVRCRVPANVPVEVTCCDWIQPRHLPSPSLTSLRGTIFHRHWIPNSCWLIWISIKDNVIIPGFQRGNWTLNTIWIPLES